MVKLVARRRIALQTFHVLLHLRSAREAKQRLKSLTTVRHLRSFRDAVADSYLT